MSVLKERAGIAMNVRVQLADVAPDRQVTLGALALVDELGNMLWHMKYGEDLRQRALHRASLLLASRITLDGRYRRGKSIVAKVAEEKKRGDAKAERASLLVRFAHQAIIEWIADQCSVCRGRGMLGGGGRITKRVSRWPMADRSPCPSCYGKGFYEEHPFPEVPHLCTHCNGSGKEPVNAAQRALALDVPLDQYYRRWVDRFDWLRSVLLQIDAATEQEFERRLRVR